MARPANIYYSQIDISGYKKKVEKFTKTYYESMQKLMKDAAAEFVWRTVQEVAVDTGMSAASLEPLAQAVGTTILPEITPFIKKAERGWGTAMTGLSQKGRIRSVETGIKAGKSAYTFNFGSLNRPNMSFRFRINVWQYAFWEENWQSLEVGIRYFVDYIDSNYDDYIPFELADALNAYTGVK